MSGTAEQSEREWDLPVPDPAWLALHVEDVLDPELPIIDPHFHLWKIGEFNYWLPEYLADTHSGHNVEAAIYMEASTKYRLGGPEELKCIGETEFAYEQIGQSNGFVAGIIAAANLRAPEYLDRVLDAHIEASHGRLCGIRDMAGWDADPTLRDERYELPENILELPQFRQSVRHVGERGLVCNLWLYFHQLERLATVARQAPKTRVVVNHTGGPLGRGVYEGRYHEVFTVWKRGMSALAECPNVYVELGGMGMRWMGFGFHKWTRPPSSQELADAWRPHFATTVELFGANRCMFESNFPVDHEICSYVTLWNAYKRFTAGFSSAERDALFSRTALDLYGIKRP
jgi:predicted TIM-barrel fold metal-dependent hydrolase